jgi:hypothetical protein
MNRAAGGFALLALLAASVVAAQTTAPGQSTSPSSTAPSTHNPSSSSSSSPYTSQPNSESKPQTKSMKQCLAQTRANHPQLSEQEAQKVCKDAMSTTSRE